MRQNSKAHHTTMLISAIIALLVCGADVVQARDHAEVEKIAASFYRAITDFCEKKFTTKSLVTRFAPGGAIEMGEGRLPSPGKPSYIETDILVSLHTTDPATRVVWWVKPKEATGDVRELTLVPDTAARVVDYEWFLKRYKVAPGKKLPQSHPLSDIPHEHVFNCGKQQLTVVIHQIVWADPHIGKVGDIVLKRSR